MRFTPIVAASVIALGALPGGFTASSAANAPETVQQRAATFAPLTNVVALGTPDNNGNG